MWVHGRRLHLWKPSLLLQVVRRAQRVNDEPVKDVNLLFFVYFIWKLGENFWKLHFFTFGPKQCFYLTHSVRESFQKLAFQKKTKNATLNGCVSKDRANYETILTFSESSFNFLQNKVVFCTLYSRRYTAGSSSPLNFWCCSQRLAVLKELMIG